MANTNGAIARITKEIANIHKSPDLSLAVAHKDSDVRKVRALIIGPPDTPYEFGFFEFDIKFGKDYPIKSPIVRCITTNGGRCRFNPNIYNCGKVCLSILGTWRGERGEEWSSAQGLESILLSIQSLMSQNPYENEPGFEDCKKDEEGPKAYMAKVRHETLRIAVLLRLEALLDIPDNKAPSLSDKIRAQTEKALAVSSVVPQPSANGEGSQTEGTSTPDTEAEAHEYDAEATFSALDESEWDPMADLLKRRFLWYYDTYLATIEKASKEQPKGQAFELTEFEYGGNAMSGSYNYDKLRTKFELVAKALENERLSWNQQGLLEVQKASQLAVQLTFQFKQLQQKHNNSNTSTSRLEFHLPNPKNPFTWHLTLFGAPTTNLDNGVFNLTLSIPPEFPQSQPRVKFETPIFHLRVASSGILCYFPKREDEIASHLEAIVAAIEDENPSYDPRAVVNPEAFKLYWGGEQGRKLYNRKLRRCAQDSCEG